MNTTIPDIAISLVIDVLALAPPSLTVTYLTPSATLATILRQCGAVAGIASERARGDAFKFEWADVEAVTLLACFAIERHMDGDDLCAVRMLAMGRDRLRVAQAATGQEAAALYVKRTKRPHLNRAHRMVWRLPRLAPRSI